MNHCVYDGQLFVFYITVLWFSLWTKKTYHIGASWPDYLLVQCNLVSVCHLQYFDFSSWQLTALLSDHFAGRVFQGLSVYRCNNCLQPWYISDISVIYLSPDIPINLSQFTKNNTFCAVFRKPVTMIRFYMLHQIITACNLFVICT